MLAEVERISHEPGAMHRNRMGILLGNKVFVVILLAPGVFS